MIKQYLLCGLLAGVSFCDTPVKAADPKVEFVVEVYSSEHSQFTTVSQKRTALALPAELSSWECSAVWDIDKMFYMGEVSCQTKWSDTNVSIMVFCGANQKSDKTQVTIRSSNGSALISLTCVYREK